MDAEAPLPYQELFQLSPVAACVTRVSDGLVIDVNAAWEALSGIARRDAIGRTTVELGHWNDEAERTAALALVPGTLAPTVVRFKGGDPHLVRMHAVQLPVTNERPEALLLVQITQADREVLAEAAREQTAQALRATNLELQQRVELHSVMESTAHLGHWTNAEDDEEVFWSPGLFAITGRPRSQRLTRAEVRAGIHPDDRAAWLAARERRDGRELAFRWLHPDGQVRWFRTRMGLTLVKGNPQTDFGVVQDITTEREASERLAEQLRLLQNIAARVPGIFYQARLTPDGRTALGYINEAVRELFDEDAAALMREPRKLFQVLHPEDRARVIATLAYSAQHLLPWRETYRVLLPTLGLRWLSLDSTPQREPDGSVVWHGLATDVTEARQEALRRERVNRMLSAITQAQSVFIEAEDKRRAFEGLLDAFLGVTDSTYGFLGEVQYDDRDQPYLRTHAMTDISWDEASRLAFAAHADAGMEFRNLNTLFGHALRTGETVIANDPAHDPRAAGMPGGHPALNAFLGIPLAVGERLVAMVGLANQPGGYGTDDVAFLQPLLGALRQLVLAWRHHGERLRTSAQLQATGALLAEKSAALQVTLDSITQGLVKIDTEGRVSVYNRRFLELLDLPDEMMRERPLHDDVVLYQARRGDFGPEFNWVEPRARSYVALDPRADLPEQYWRRTREGRTLEIHTFRFPEGGLVRTYADVTSYIEAQEALRGERQRLAWVLEATRPGIWETNLADGSMSINDRWAEMLGYARAELEPVNHATWSSRVHPEDLPRAIEARERHTSGLLPYYECDLRLRHKDGHWVWVNSRGRVHQRDAEDRALYMSGTHLDISERVAAQEQIRALNAGLEQRVRERTAELERSMRDMEAISYSIAHDLRAPLRSVNGFAQILAEEESQRLSESGREMFLRISRSARNMGQMITDMLELLRVVQVELEPRPVDMTALAHAVAESLGPQAPQLPIEVGELPEALGDATLLRQVLSNLVDNAMKYSRQQAEPRVWLGHDPALHAYFVRDNGMGFDMARAAKLFGLFQRLHANSEVPGMGVGLAIVQRIVERHGGRVWAESAPGQGATFWFSLPRA